MTPGPRKCGLKLSGGVRSLPQVRRRSAGRRARPVWRARAPSAKRMATCALRGAVTGQWRLSALRPLTFSEGRKLRRAKKIKGKSKWNEANRENARAFTNRFRRLRYDASRKRHHFP